MANISMGQSVPIPVVDLGDDVEGNFLQLFEGNLVPFVELLVQKM